MSTTPAELRAGDLMSRRFLAVAPEDTLGEIAEKLAAANAGSALVLEFGRLTGILTSRDVGALRPGWPGLITGAGSLRKTRNRCERWPQEVFGAVRMARSALASTLDQKVEAEQEPRRDGRRGS